MTNTKDYSAPGWESIRSEATKVVFESSFENAVVTSCYKWFDNFIGLTTVTGLEYLKISETSSETETSNTSAGSMFSHCSALTSLDLSNFENLYNLSSVNQMFKDCSALKFLDLSNAAKKNP